MFKKSNIKCVLLYSVLLELEYYVDILYLTALRRTFSSCMSKSLRCHRPPDRFILVQDILTFKKHQYFFVKTSFYTVSPFTVFTVVLYMGLKIIFGKIVFFCYVTFILLL